MVVPTPGRRKRGPLQENSRSQREDWWHIIRDKLPVLATISAGKNLPRSGTNIHTTRIFCIGTERLSKYS